MAVALTGTPVQNYSAGSSSTHVLSITVPADALAVTVHMCRVGTDDVASVTIGSDNLVAIPGASVNDGTVRTDVWGLANPTIQTADITVTYAAAQTLRHLWGACWNGLDTADPWGNVQTGSGSGNPSETLTGTVAGDMGVDMCAEAAAGTPDASQTVILADLVGSSTIPESWSTYEVATTTTVVMSGTIGTFFDHVAWAINQSAAAGGPAGPEAPFVFPTGNQAPRNFMDWKFPNVRWNDWQPN